MERYVCIHGHFYQPPRENPWLEVIELQDSAYPYHDWNERVTAEAYGPNARSRILDGDGRIVKIVNNYATISFDVGPTLLKWLEDEKQDVYQAILDADRLSIERFSGHGAAMAQPFGHMIMPLASSRDKYTQVLWGVRDFEHRFGRRPEGMWLPEAAVDMETLDYMARLGIQFTILEPGQARRVRRSGGRSWKDVSGGGIDPTRPYTVRLPSGRKIDVFFYDGPISRAVAFEGILSSGEQFADRLAGGFSDQRTWPQIVHIATDGESYGHHHRHGDMALAYAVEHIATNGAAQLTNYGEYLARHPSGHEVEIIERTSWSCGHGVERWQSDCGCNTGGHPGWNQTWRAPLRQSLDWLRDQVAPQYERRGRALLRDPWAARDDYIDVILNREPHNIQDYFRRHAHHELSEEERTTTLKLLELQRHAMLMYTSCGWFFDDISGIEATQVLQYAGRVIQLARELFAIDVENGFLDILQNATSNIPEQGNGRRIYERFVRPAVVNLGKVGAHFAVSSLFESYPERSRIYCYIADMKHYQAQEAGMARLAVGRVKLTSVITGESEQLTFGVLHFGDHNITAGVRPFRAEEAYAEMVREVTGTFYSADLPEVIRLLDKHFGELTYSLKSLFRDERRKILDLIMQSTLGEAEASYRQIFEHHAPLMRFILDSGAPVPPSFHAAAELVLNANLRHALEEDVVDPERARGLMAEAQFWKVELDSVGLAYTIQKTAERLAGRFARQPEEISTLQALAATVATIRSLAFPVDVSEIQNCYYGVLKGSYQGLRERASEGAAEAGAWIDLFLALGADLAVHVE